MNIKYFIESKIPLMVRYAMISEMLKGGKYLKTDEIYPYILIYVDTFVRLYVYTYANIHIHSNTHTHTIYIYIHIHPIYIYPSSIPSQFSGPFY